MKSFPVALSYYASFAITPIFGLLQTKILAMILPVKAFGELQLLIPLIAWGVLIGGVGTPQFLVRFYHGKSSKVFGECTVLTMCATLLFTIVAYALISHFSVLSAFFVLSPTLWLMMVFSIATGVIFAIAQAQARAASKHMVYNASAIFGRFCTSTCAVAGVWLFLKSPNVGFLAGSALGTSLALGAIWLMLFRENAPAWKLELPSRKAVREMLLYGVPIVSVLLLSDFLGSLNRFVIAKWIGTSEVGTYVVGYMLANIFFTTLYNPLLTFLHPLIFKAWEANDRKTVENLLNYYLAFYLGTALILYGFLSRFEDILTCLVAGPAYRLAPGVFPILLISCLIIGIYRFAVTHYLLRKNTSELALSFGLAVAVDVFAAILLCKHYGVMGAAIGVLLGNVVLLTVTYFRGINVLSLKIFSRNTALTCLVAAAMTLVPISHLWRIDNRWRLLDALASCIISLLIWGFMFRGQISSVYKSLKGVAKTAGPRSLQARD